MVVHSEKFQSENKISSTPALHLLSDSPRRLYPVEFILPHQLGLSDPVTVAVATPSARLVVRAASRTASNRLLIPRLAPSHTIILPPLTGLCGTPRPVHSVSSTIVTTATPLATPSPAGASVTAPHNAKTARDSSINSSNTMVSGVSPAVASNVNGGAAHDHGRKPSVVINASGATGYTPMGGPVGQNARPPIVFGSTDSDIPPPPPAAGVPHDVPSTSRDTHQRDPRVTDHAPSPSPIPQPHASGGRPPLMLQNQSNGMMFGSMGGDAEHVSGVAMSARDLTG